MLQSRTLPRLINITRSFTMSAQAAGPAPTWPRSPVPNDRPRVKTAACLIIGDEVLNGKTKDSNSNFMAKKLFDLGIDLKRVEVIADDVDEIIEAARRMVKNYDFVISSGGIGPTHDDITYESLAKAFDDEGKLEYHDETLKRMDESIKHRYANDPSFTKPTPEVETARKRMALFPAGAEVFYVNETMWVPIVRLQRKLCILPGIPRLFEGLLEGLLEYIELPPAEERPFRVLIHTSMPEAAIAPFLTKLSQRVKAEDIRVGSYPKLLAGVDVSLIGLDEARLKEIAQEVATELQGEVASAARVGEEKK